MLLVKSMILKKIKNKIINYIEYTNRVNSLEMHKQNVRTLYEYYSMNNKESGIVARGNDSELIVSLTTYGERVYTVHLVIESLFMQTLKPNRVILWLAEDEFSGSKLPITLISKMERGLEIRYCQDLRSYKKLIPCRELFPDANIVTVDDDVIYPHDFLENLYLEHCEHPEDVIFTRGRIIACHSGEVKPYAEWSNNKNMCGDSLRYLPIGVGGVLYPPHSLNGEVFNQENFQKLAPYADDLWFKTMSLLNKTQSRQTSFGRGVNSDDQFLSRFVPIEDEQQEKLSEKNVVERGNDAQFKRLVEFYDLMDILMED